MLEQLVFATIVTIIIIILVVHPASAILVFSDLTLIRYTAGFIFNALDILRWRHAS